MSNNSDNTSVKRIDELCAKAIEDIQKKTDVENEAKYGYKLQIGFVQASRVLGAKYFKKNFGKMPIEDIRKMVGKNNSKRRW